MLSYATDLIPDFCGQYLNNLELHNMPTNCMSLFFIIFTQRQNIYNTGRNAKYVTFGETAKTPTDNTFKLNF